MGKTNKFQMVKDLNRKQRLKFQLGLLPMEIVQQITPTERKKRIKPKPPVMEKKKPSPKSASIEKSKRTKLDKSLPNSLPSKTDDSVKRKRRRRNKPKKISELPFVVSKLGEPSVNVTLKPKTTKKLVPNSLPLKTDDSVKEKRRRKKQKKMSELSLDVPKLEPSVNGILKPKRTKNQKPDADYGEESEPGRKVAKMELSVVKNGLNSKKILQKMIPATKGHPKKLVSLREKMTEKLKGARFRFINETLYTTTSTEAMQMFKEDPTAYEVYHDGYNMQKSRWPIDPLDLIIKHLKKLSDKTIIADMGCGDARLSKSIAHKVHSFDLVASNENVTACDMANVPLEDESVDVCVYCLSLMGTNLAEYFGEANRILKPNGLVKVVEIASRFISKKDFRRSLEKIGFQLIKQTQPNDYFVQMDFEKVGKVINKRPPGLNLKPCRYKKR